MGSVASVVECVACGFRSASVYRLSVASANCNSVDGRPGLWEFLSVEPMLDRDAGHGVVFGEQRLVKR